MIRRETGSERDLDFETDVLVVAMAPGRRVGIDRPDICELVPHLLAKASTARNF